MQTEPIPKIVTIRCVQGGIQVSPDPVYVSTIPEHHDHVEWRADNCAFKIIFPGESPFPGPSGQPDVHEFPPNGFGNRVTSGTPKGNSGNGREYRYIVVCQDPKRAGEITLLDPTVKPWP